MALKKIKKNLLDDTLVSEIDGKAESDNVYTKEEVDGMGIGTYYYGTEEPESPSTGMVWIIEE